VTPDLSAPWHDLGLTRGNEDPELDALPPIAAMREAITAGRGTWRSMPAQCDCHGLLPFTFNRRSARAAPTANIHVPQISCCGLRRYWRNVMVRRDNLRLG